MEAAAHPEAAAPEADPRARSVGRLGRAGRGRPLRGWLGRTRHAVSFATAERDVAVLALAGFLVRGGIVVVALPAVVLPSFLGLAAVFGANAFGIDGRPTAWLVEAGLVAGVAIVTWLLGAVILGSIVDVWLVRAAAARDPRAVDRPQTLPSFWLVMDMAAMRAVCLLPLGAAAWVAVQPIYQAAYDELTMPTNLSDPLLLRAAAKALLPLLGIFAAWLVTETLAAIGVRRLVMGAGFLDAIGGAILQVVRRPLSTLLTLALTTSVSILGVAISTLATAVAFGLCLDAARLPADYVGSQILVPIVFALTAILLSIAWGCSLGIAAITSAWRSAAWTEETAAARDAA